MQNLSLPIHGHRDNHGRSSHRFQAGVTILFIGLSFLLVAIAVTSAGIGWYRGLTTSSTPTTETVSLVQWDSSPQQYSPRTLQEVVEGGGGGNCTLECCSDYKGQLCDEEAKVVVEEEGSWTDSIPFSVQVIFVVILLILSSIFSGLTLGLLSLDPSGLEIVMSGDDPENARYAKDIYPVRKNGNRLLCTLIVGNVAVNALISIFMADFGGGLVGFLSSTILIVIFGEITPQAACARYPLKLGSLSVPIVKCIMVLFCPVTVPLAWCLDKVLGEELATTYSNAEMTKLLQIQVQQNALDHEVAGAMTGALTYKNIKVREVMTPVERTFMLNVDLKLSFETMSRIFKSGYSRIPVYEVSKNNIIGLLFVKDLIFIDPADNVPIKNFIQILGRDAHMVWPDDSLGDTLGEFKKGKRSHLAIVRDVNNETDSADPFYEVVGIITLEDIIEKIIGVDIVDETDEYVNSRRDLRVDREGFEWARLRLLDTQLVDELLSPSEAHAVAAHFRMNYSEAVKLLTDTQLTRLVATTPIVTLETAARELGKELPEELLYTKGIPSDTCTLILGGKVSVFVGAENFQSDLSSWAVMGISAIQSGEFVPDFTAFVSDGPCRCLRLTRAAFEGAVDASAVERQVLESPQRDTITLSSSADATNRREQLLAHMAKRENHGLPIIEEATPEPDANGDVEENGTQMDP